MTRRSSAGRWSSCPSFPAVAGRGQTEDRHAIQGRQGASGEGDHLVIATDADREGELIAREIIDLCGYRGPIERLWLSALNDASIRTALGKLRPSSIRCRCITRRWRVRGQTGSWA